MLSTQHSILSTDYRFNVYFYPMQNHAYDIAIIGGGLSGALTAINLMRTAKAPTRIVLIEKEPENLLRGVAYHATSRYLPLNVPVKKMSLISSDHHHFERWLAANKDKHADAVPDASPDSFVSRGVYGHYIEDTFHETLASKPEGLEVEELVNEVVAMDAPGADGYCTLHMGKGDDLKVKKVVLALGNFPPVNVPLADTSFFSSTHYLPSAWDFKKIETVGKNEDVLVIGTGLSMLDVIITLDRVGYQGKVSTISLQGLLPRPHGPATELPIIMPADINTALGLFTALREQIRIAEEQGHSWITVLDSIRGQTPAIWKRLSTKEKQHFMRHLRHHWDVHRHRIPQASQALMDRLAAEGRSHSYAGKLVSLKEKDSRVEAVFKKRGETETQSITVDKVVNCTGPHPDFTRVPSLLVAQLLQSGQAKVDDMKIGFEAADDYAMIKGDGTASNYLYLVGPMLKAAWWESIALREIRQQAEALPGILLPK